MDYDRPFDLYSVFSGPCVCYAPSAFWPLYSRWSCALMDKLKSFSGATFHRLGHFADVSIQYMCVVTCLAPLVICSSRHVICQLHFAIALVALSLLFCIPFFPLPPLSALSSGSCAGARTGLSRSTDRSKYTCADPQLSVSDFIREHGAYFDSQRSVATQVNGDSTSLWNISFWCSGDTMVGVCKKRWWYWGGLGAPVCLCVSTVVNNSFVQSFGEVDYKEA